MEVEAMERKKAEKAAKKAAKAAKRAAKAAAKDGDEETANGDGAAGGGAAAHAPKDHSKNHEQTADDRTTTGILTSEKNARDVKIIQFSLALYGKTFVQDTTIELNWGNRYGLVGRNGCGKSSLLKCLAERDVPLPEHIDTYLLAEEAKPSELSALEYVIAEAKEELVRIEALIEKILVEDGPDAPTLMDLYDRQEELDESTFESRASTILVGLGFDRDGPGGVTKKCCDMSGGWRMRVALAKALFMSPSMLLLDEPTNHLDLGACVWLENYLSTYSKILVVVSHSQDFLNGVCTNMMVMEQSKLKYWGGNYDTYVKTRAEQDRNQMMLYKKQQDEIKHYKEFIASCGTYSNLVKQAKSRQKVLDKMEEAGLLEPPHEEPRFRFRFPPTHKLTPPLISFSDVAFSYSGKKAHYLFDNLNFGIDSDSRISLVGPNGAGKSTLLKLMVGQNEPCEGSVTTRGGMVIGRYHQHSAEILDMDMNPVEYIMSKFKPKYPDYKTEQWRGVVGQWGIPSEYHFRPIGQLSEGLKMRLAFCEIAQSKPHVLLLDEPTNAADMEMIDSLAEAINAYEGGVVIISHDFRLLSQTAKEIWVVDKGAVTVFDGDIRQYKKTLG